jgi:hypothetical protein
MEVFEVHLAVAAKLGERFPNNVGGRHGGWLPSEHSSTLNEEVRNWYHFINALQQESEGTRMAARLSREDMKHMTNKLKYLLRTPSATL